MMKSLVLLTGALLASTAAAAQAPSGTQSESADADDNRVICRNVADLGTRLARSRVCRTRAEWEALRRDSRNQIDRAQTTRVHRSDE